MKKNLLLLLIGSLNSVYIYESICRYISSFKDNIIYIHIHCCYEIFFDISEI